MYTFYFRTKSVNLAGTVRFKLIALKGLHTPISPSLGENYGEETLRGLVQAGHKVVIEPRVPSKAPHPELCKGLGDTDIPTMRYAKGYGPPKPTSWSYDTYFPKGLPKQWIPEYHPSIGPLPPQAPLAPESSDADKGDILMYKWVKNKASLSSEDAETICPGSAQKLTQMQKTEIDRVVPLYKLEYRVPLPEHVGETVVGVAQKLENPVVWYRRSRWDLFKAWFSRNFLPY